MRMVRLLKTQLIILNQLGLIIKGEKKVNEKFLGKILHFDDKLNIFTIRADFLDPDKKQFLYELFQSGKTFSFWFKKQYKESKTKKQINTYFMLLGQILTKSDIYPTKEAVSALDKYIMENLWPCKTLHIYDQELPIPPSKADLNIEEFAELIQIILDAYSELNLGIESID